MVTEESMVGRAFVIVMKFSGLRSNTADVVLYTPIIIG